jgi:hypothetical protein
MTPDELGEKGEARFKELCADAGLTYHKPTRDRNGWDALVEWPIPDQSTKTLDVRSRGSSCFVQVKTKWVDIDEVKFSLAALERLTKELMPSFIAIFSISEDKQVVGLRIIHVDAEIQKLVLKKLRKISAENQEVAGKSITLKLSKYGKEVTPEGTSMKKFIESCIGTEMANYVAQKEKSFKTIGYESGFMQITFQFSAESPEHLEDAFLGLRDVQSEVLSQSSTRFGISIPDNMLPIEKGKFTFLPNENQGGFLRFKTHPASGFTHIEGLITVVDLPLHASMKGPLLAFKSGLFTCKFRVPPKNEPGKFESTITITAWEKSKRATVAHWIAFFQFILHFSGTPQLVWLGGHHIPSTEFGKMSVNLDKELVQYFQSLTSTLQVIQGVLNGCNESDKLLSFEEITKFKEFGPFIQILLEPSLTKDCFSGALEAEESKILPYNGSALVFTACHFFELTFLFGHEAQLEFDKQLGQPFAKLWLRSLLSIDLLSSDEQDSDYKRVVNDTVARLSPSIVAMVLLQNDEGALKPKLSFSLREDHLNQTALPSK